MLFKGTILDFHQQYKKLDFQGVTLIESKDPFWSKLVNNKLRENHSNLFSRWGEDLKEEWVNEFWFDLSLFSDPNCYFIYNTETSNKKCLELLTQIDSPTEKVFLHFKKIPKEFSKTYKSNIVSIGDFKFWELDKLLDFYEVLLNVRISSGLRNYFSTSTIEQKQEIFDQVNYLSLIYEDLTSISLSDAQEVLATGEINPFVFTDYVADKKLNDVYINLLDGIKNGQWASSHKAITFLRSFIMKSVDPGYKSKKPKLNAFDKKVIAVQRKYAPREISVLLKDLSHWEILVKRKDSGIMQELQSKIIARV